MRSETIVFLVVFFCGIGIMLVSYNAYISPMFENIKSVQNLFFIFTFIGFAYSLLSLTVLILNKQKKAVV